MKLFHSSIGLSCTVFFHFYDLICELIQKVLGAGLNKTRRNSNWEQRPLSANQVCNLVFLLFSEEIMGPSICFQEY